MVQAAELVCVVVRVGGWVGVGGAACSLQQPPLRPQRRPFTQLKAKHPGKNFAIICGAPVNTKQKSTAQEGYANLNNAVILEHTASGVQVGASGSRQ